MTWLSVLRWSGIRDGETSFAEQSMRSVRLSYVAWRLWPDFASAEGSRKAGRGRIMGEMKLVTGPEVLEKRLRIKSRRL